jgi:ribosome assembly protein YihI (activator of Der GTPase)
VFLDDLISYHLDIEPKKITTDELQQLLTWLEIVSSLIIEDQKAVQEYLSRVKKLSGVSNG